ncbi:uncharacterized protein LOC132705113 [Cylas formicarius]|uniref:Odorant binding protein n=2 Tax=Neoptera TaxID=33340 RepID=A0A6B7M084_CYLFO|nr:uncharacterized protein LOC132705113 [Cylas formicarius]QFO46781.1 odorant binding protein [Cylas formicarius]
MRVIFVLCSVFVASLAYTNEDIQKLKQFHSAFFKCQESPATHIDEEVLTKVRNHQRLTQVPENTGDFLLCLAQHLQLQDADGNLNLATIRERIQHHEKDPSRVDELMDTCIVQKLTPQYTAIHMFACLSREGLKVGHTKVEALLEVL